MTLFTAELKNQPGELAHLMDCLAKAKVNVMLAGSGIGDLGSVVFTVDNETGARTALEAEGIDIHEHPAIQVRLSNRPGTGAELTRRLADAGVNVTAFLPIRISDDYAVGVLAADDIEAAKKALGDLVMG